MQILAELQKEGGLVHPEDTAVVLPDENLLFPMLGAIPEGIDKVNVTMGCSLSASSGVSLFHFGDLQADCRRKDGQDCFYHRDVTGLLEHPFFIAAADRETSRGLSARIRTENLIFIPAAEFLAIGGIYATVFPRRAEPRTFRLSQGDHRAAAGGTDSVRARVPVPLPQMHGAARKHGTADFSYRAEDILPSSYTVHRAGKDTL